jgi:hypothetical protein
MASTTTSGNVIAVAIRAARRDSADSAKWFSEVDYGAGQRPGDAVDGLDAGDHELS